MLRLINRFIGKYKQQRQQKQQTTHIQNNIEDEFKKWTNVWNKQIVITIIKCILYWGVIEFYGHFSVGIKFLKRNEWMQSQLFFMTSLYLYTIIIISITNSLKAQIELFGLVSYFFFIWYVN